MISNLASEKIWTDKSRFDQAESKYHQLANKEMKSATNCCIINGKSAINTNQIDRSSVINVNAIDVAENNEVKAKKNKKIKKKTVANTSNSNANENANANANVSADVPCMSITESSTEVNASVVQISAKKKKKMGVKQQAMEWKQQALELKQELENLKRVQPQAGDKLVITTDNQVAAVKNSDKLDSLVAKAEGSCSNSQSTLVSEIAKAREHIKNSLEKMDGIATLASSSTSGEVLDRISALEKDNSDLRKLVEQLRVLNLESQKRISALEASIGKTGTVAAAVKTAEKAKPAAKDDDDDDDVDLFGSDDEEEDKEAAALREKRLAAYAEKKSKKPALIAKSSLVLDVKPWDDETDLKVMETEIRKITADGLLWGASKFAPVAFGIQKLTISCVVEDDKISIDWLTEEIEKLEDYVQSVDVAAFNKI